MVSLFIQMADRVCKVIIFSDVTLAELARSVSLRPTANSSSVKKKIIIMREN